MRVERDFFGVYDLSESKVVRFHLYESQDGALEAAGCGIGDVAENRLIWCGPRPLSVATILCVLYDDPVGGFPPVPARRRPAIERYYDGQTTPTPEAIDFRPGELLGCVSGELGLRGFLEDAGHTLVVTSDKDGPDFRVRAPPPGGRRRHLTALLAGVPDRRAHRQGAEPEARDHGRDRLRPR